MTSSSTRTERQSLNPPRARSLASSQALVLITAYLKGFGVAVGLILVAVPALTCHVEWLFSTRDLFFLFWGQTFALLPGLPGHYVRKSFYFLTLRRCSLNCEIGFLTYIHDRRTEIGKEVYIGTGVGIGWVIVGDHCLLASRVSVLSGRAQHQRGPDGRLTPFDRRDATQVHIGPDTWIGEGAIVMADVESGCIVAAGSIVTKTVISGSIVAGNPARSIKKHTGSRDLLSETEESCPPS